MAKETFGILGGTCLLFNAPDEVLQNNIEYLFSSLVTPEALNILKHIRVTIPNALIERIHINVASRPALKQIEKGLALFINIYLIGNGVFVENSVGDPQQLQVLTVVQHSLFIHNYICFLLGVDRLDLLLNLCLQYFGDLQSGPVVELILNLLGELLRLDAVFNGLTLCGTLHVYKQLLDQRRHVLQKLVSHQNGLGDVFAHFGNVLNQAHLSASDDRVEDFDKETLIEL